MFTFYFDIFILTFETINVEIRKYRFNNHFVNVDVKKHKIVTLIIVKSIKYMVMIVIIEQ